MIHAPSVSPCEAKPTSGDNDCGQQLCEAVQDALSRTGITWLRRVNVDTCHGRVILSGTLPSFYMKQLAQAAAMKVSGVGTIQNELHVSDASHPCA